MTTQNGLSLKERTVKEDETGLYVSFHPMSRTMRLTFPTGKKEEVLQALPDLKYDGGYALPYERWPEVREMGIAVFDVDLGEWQEPESVYGNYVEPKIESWQTDADPDCPLCRGIGYLSRRDVPITHKRFAERIVCPCFAILQEKERLAAYADFEHMSLATWQGPDAIREQVQAFSRNENDLRFLVLIGPQGSGKTHLAISAVKLAHSVMIPAQIAYVQRLWDELREATGEGKFNQAFEQYSRVPLLAIDDKGTENNTAWINERADYLINERYTLGVKTVVTMNMQTQDLPGRIHDRIFDAKYGLTIQLTGASWRVKADR